MNQMCHVKTKRAGHGGIWVLYLFSCHQSYDWMEILIYLLIQAGGGGGITWGESNGIKCFICSISQSNKSSEKLILKLSQLWRQCLGCEVGKMSAANTQRTFYFQCLHLRMRFCNWGFIRFLDSSKVMNILCYFPASHN